MRLSNENKGIANYAYSSKPKNGKPSEQEEKAVWKRDRTMKVKIRNKKWKNVKLVEENTKGAVSILRHILQFSALRNPASHFLLFQPKRSYITFRKLSNTLIQRQRLAKY